MKTPASCMTLASAEVSPRPSGPVQAAHSVQVSECRAQPSAQGPPRGHTRSVGGGGGGAVWGGERDVQG